MFIIIIIIPAQWSGGFKRTDLNSYHGMLRLLYPLWRRNFRSGYGIGLQFSIMKNSQVPNFLLSWFPFCPPSEIISVANNLFTWLLLNFQRSALYGMSLCTNGVKINDLVLCAIFLFLFYKTKSWIIMRNAFRSHIQWRENLCLCFLAVESGQNYRGLT